MITRLIKVLALVLLTSLAGRTALAAESVCASVQLQIQQSLTLERQAFDAHLGITNGQAAVLVANVDVDLVVTDQQGNAVDVSYDPYDPNAQNVKFFVKLDRMENITDVAGVGTVAPGTVADVHWLIIPTVGAAEGMPAGKTYRIGATLNYTLAGEPFTMEIEPDTILVKPLPALFVDYFFPADVYADDPFTPDLIEEAIPFTIGQRVANTGVGTAKSVAIESSQVRIERNDPHLLVGFRLEGTEVNGLTAPNTLQAALGDIAPAAVATARWIMTTTLSGRFSVFSAQYTHADELGGAVTSVIAGTGVHSLVHDVLADLPGKDGIRDFLAVDTGSYILYESENLNTAVADLSASASLSLAGQSGTEATYALTTPITAGYGYLKLVDPHAGQRVLRQMQRSDGKVISADNVWLAKRYNKDAGQWTYSFNLFDANSTGSYTVVFADPPEAPHAPELQFIDEKIVVEGSLLSFSVLATDADGTTPSLSAAPLAVGAVFVDGGHGSGTFTWTPAVGQAGSYTVTFSADAGALSDARDVLITVRSIFDTDGDGLPDTWELQYFGNLSRDGSGDYDGDGLSDSAEYLAGTNPANRAPLFTPPIGDKSVAENSTLVFTVTATDPDGTTPVITASAPGPCAGASFDGAVFSWTPTYDQSGVCAVTFRASDGERDRDALEIVQITVLNVNRAPTVPRIISPQTQSEVSVARPSLVVENSVDPDGDAVKYSFEIYSSEQNIDPDHLEAASGLVEEQLGTTSWTVGGDLPDNAKHYWRVLASDGADHSIWADGNFFVNTVNDPPGDFAAASPAAGTDVAVLTPEFAVTNSSDIDGDLVSYSYYIYSDVGLTQLIDSATGVPAGTGGSTAWTGTVPLADNTWHFWEAVATDEHGLSTAIQPLTFFVNTANDAPTMPTVASPADGGEVASGSVSLTVNNATDLDGDVLTYFFELDTADTFATPNKVVSGPVAQGGGTTLWNVSGLTENTRYYWHCKAADGWVESPWATTVASFFVNATNDAPSAPTQRNPGAGSHVDSVTPRLELFAATDPDLDAMEYEYEVYAQPPGSPIAVWRTAATDWVVAPSLDLYQWHSWRARAVDAHGLAGPWTALTTFFTDNNVIDDPPTITVTEPSAAVVKAGGTFTIAWVDGDPDSDASISLYRDNDGMGENGTLIVAGLSEDADGPSGSYVWDLTGVPAGIWYIYAVITDGNTTGTDYAPGTVTIDGGAPQTVASPGAGSFAEQVTVTLTATDDFDPAPVIHFTVDGTAPTLASPVYTVPLTFTTTTTLRYFASDASGRQEIPSGPEVYTITQPISNLAYNKTASASSSRSGSTPAMAIDGTTNTSWKSNATGTQYVQVDLGSVQSIANVKILWPATYYARSFTIQTSTDGTNFTQCYPSSGNATGTGAMTNATFTMVSARYVRVNCTEAKSTYYSISEVEVYATAPTNQAIYKTADASTTRTTYVASRAVDASTSTSWMSSTTTGDQWVQVDLGGTGMNISNAKVIWPATYYAKNFKIQISTNGTAWTDKLVVASGSGTTASTTFTPATARYVRVYCTLRNNNSYYGVAELEVYQ